MQLTMTIQVAARKAPLYAEQTVHLDPPLIENALVGFLLEVTNIRVKNTMNLNHFIHQAQILDGLGRSSS